MEQEPENVLKCTQQIVQIIPKSKSLSANELIALRNYDIPTVSAGLKRTNVQNNPEEQNLLDKLYENLKTQLSRPRIERLEGRAVGVWDFEKNLVRVERRDGKFGNFGFSIGGQLYLEYYEALFLLEVNRLQLEYNTVIISIEQAYLLLLGEQHSPKYHEYLVYSNLTRVGYILVKHQNKHFQNHQINSESDCVWAILDAELQDDTVADYVKKTPYFSKVKQKFDEIKNAIKNQIENTKKTKTTTNNEVVLDLKFSEKICPRLKRKTSEEAQNDWMTAKRRCNYALTTIQKSLVDFLKDEDEFKQFKEMFEKFDMVPLKLNENKSLNSIEQDSEIKIADDEEQNNSFSTLHINFDVYLHNEGFRKSCPHLPNFRVIILKPDQKFPTHDEIFVTHRLQLNPVPLLIVSVNDSKQIQAFLYYFS